MIRMNNVSFHYQEKPACGIRNIHLHIPRGQCVLLAGGSGCGKTTLTRLINGLALSFYGGTFSGELTIKGRNIRKLNPTLLATLVGSVFQNPRSQFFNLDTTGEIAFGCENIGLPRAEIRRRIQRTVQMLRIEHLMDRDIFALSGGEKQRVAIASVCAMEPEIFVLDEPSANLDTLATLQLRETLRILKAEGKTIVIAEHRLHYLQGIADRVFYMDNGQIAQEWTAHEFEQLSPQECRDKGLRSYDLTKLTVDKIVKKASGGGLLCIENLAVMLNRGCKILENISLETAGGEVIAITGSNGQGKSTLARCLCGLIKEAKGSVFLEGKPVTHKQRLGAVYLVMQEPNCQLFTDSVENELLLSLAGARQPATDAIPYALTALSLAAVRERHPISLSGGEKQRTAIAAGIVQNARIIILDEPTSGLDYRNMQRVKNVVATLKEKGKTIFLITHDYEFLLSVCDRIVELENGTIRQDYLVTENNLAKIQAGFIG